MHNQSVKMKFYFIVAIGLEQLAVKEFIEKTNLLDIEFEDIEIGKGGFEALISFEKGPELNRVLKIPQRILLRITEFKCRDFPKLFKKMKSLDWSNWLHGQSVKWTASARTSRLIHTGKIAKTCSDAIDEFYKAKTPKTKDLEQFGNKTLHFYIRIVDDIATISFNTSGVDLYKRGRTIVNRAPLRETYSAALFYMAKTYFNLENINLIDPMCGSGVILKEAITFYDESVRSFGFEDLKLYERYPLKKMSYTISCKGADIDSEVLETAEKNLENLNIEISKKDFFDQSFEQNQLIIFNPPYNERIKIENAKKFFIEIGQKLKSKKALVLLPSDYVKASGGKPIATFLNGGIDVTIVVYS